jgi:DNA-binding LacI/PurR family transcriptional regulator/GAF domain-containing protein
MNEKQKLDNKKDNRRRNGRLTIGYLATNIYDQVGLSRWSGISDRAWERGINLISFSGGYWHDLETHEQANVIYDLVNPEELDGIILGNIVKEDLVDLDEFQVFLERFQVPMVGVRQTLEGIPYILLDNYQGMREAMVHLVEVHGHRRIAFLRGPEAHPYAQERYRAYTDVLEEYGLSLDVNIITPPSDWDEMAIQVLLDERQLRPGEDFEAVVAVNDLKALDAIKVLQERGIRIPGDVAVVGFNDVIEGRTITPPLTSVQLPFYKQGWQTTELLLALLEGRDVSEQVVLPAQLVVRQSCGCFDSAVVQAAAGPVIVADESLEVALAWRREDILSDLVQAAGTSVAGLRPGWAGRLLDDFVTELRGESSGVFLRTLEEVLQQVMEVGGDTSTTGGMPTSGQDVATWQGAVSTLRRNLLPYLGDSEVRSRAENLWRQARAMIGEAAQRAEAYQALQAEQQARTLREIGQSLITTFDVEELMDILAQELPRLGIERCYLSLYENPAKPAESSRLILAYDEKGRVELGVGGQNFPSPQLVPEGMLSQEMQHNLIVEPLYFRESQLGFVLFETGPREGAVYEVLRGEIISTLPAALLVERRRQAEEAMAKRATELELVARVSAAASTILNPTELLQQVVDLTKDSFGLYHAHVYLLDEAGETLVLAAGTGKVGRQMVAEGWRIPFRQEQSLVARAARTREGFIVNDVRADPNWLPNPLLPDTRSELAVPLVAGEWVLGVLDVQADKVDHFTEDDIRIQRTLAAQVAVALENARLFEQEQANLAFAERLYQAGRRITAAGDLQEIVAAVAEAVPMGVINRMVLCGFEYEARGKLEGMAVQANWHSGQGTPPMLVGTRYQRAMFPGIELFVGSEPMIFGEIQHDERFDGGLRAVWQQLNIRAMVALPLWVGMRQMGVLLLQAEEVYQLSEEEIRPYVSLMGQVAVAVENQRLLAEANAALEEVEAAQRRYTVQAWEVYRAKKEVQSYEQVRERVALTGSDVPMVALPTPEDQSRSIISNQPVAVNGQQREAQSSLVVPLTVREDVIGVLGLQETDEREWTPDEIALLEAIVEQLARAYENLRLIEETQQKAAREARINEIGEKIRGAQSLEEALQIAIREVGRSLEAPQTVVKLEVSDL